MLSSLEGPFRKRSQMNRTKLLVLVATAAAAMGCGSDPKPPPAAPSGGVEESSVGTTTTTNEASPSNDKDPRQSTINIDPEIQKACGIKDSDANFGFNSANIRPQDHEILGKLAKCFIDGPLAGRQMRLVGHADPRGSDEYNMALGGDRAENVKKFVGQKGLALDKMETSSRGELDATGTDEASWFRDRRVDVLLAD